MMIMKYRVLYQRKLQMLKEIKIGKLLNLNLNQEEDKILVITVQQLIPLIILIKMHFFDKFIIKLYIYKNKHNN